MLLHRKRIQGNLNGLGYQNPYVMRNESPLYVHPLERNQYLPSLILITKEYADEENIRRRFRYSNQTNRKDEIAPKDNDFIGDVETMMKGGGIEEGKDASEAELNGALLNYYDGISANDGDYTMNVYGRYEIPNYKLNALTNSGHGKMPSRKPDFDLQMAPNLEPVEKPIEEPKDTSTSDFDEIMAGMGISRKSNKNKDLEMPKISKRIRKEKKMGKYPSSNIKSKLLKKYASSKKKLERLTAI